MLTIPLVLPTSVCRRQLGVVYCIRCGVNGKTYIGSTTRLIEPGQHVLKILRVQNHLSALRSGRHPKSDMQEDWNTYGEESFEVFILDVRSASEFSDIGRGESLRGAMKAIEKEWAVKMDSQYSREHKLSESMVRVNEERRQAKRLLKEECKAGLRVQL